MNEIDFKILEEEKILIVTDASDKRITEADRDMECVLRLELARNFKFYYFNPDKTVKIPSEFSMSFLEWLKNNKTLKTQPYFPDIFYVNPDGLDLGSISSLSDDVKPIRRVIYRSTYKEELLNCNKNLKSLNFKWLSGEVLEEPTKLLVEFFSNKLTGNRITAKREDRRVFMKALDQIPDLFDSKLYLINYWKKIAYWIHPSDFPGFPRAAKFLFQILKHSKKDPEKPKLRSLMWKGWENGKDFEAFESYLDHPNITPFDILTSLHDYERNPRVSRWKKTGNIKIGKENVGQDEIDVVDLILLQLKEKILKMVNHKENNLKIPSKFYKIPAYAILKNPMNTVDDLLQYLDIVGVKISASTDQASIKTYDLNGVERVTSELITIGQDCFIVGYKKGGWENVKINVQFLHRTGTVIGEELKVPNEKFNSIILFGYNSITRTLKWIGEPSKVYYAGKPSKIENWKKIWDILMVREPVLTLGELAEKMYPRKGEPSLNEVTEDMIREDLGLIYKNYEDISNC